MGVNNPKKRFEGMPGTANVVTEKDGVPILFSEFKRGFVVRVVHEQNKKAPSKNLSVCIAYLSPGGVIAPHHHSNEEVYVILEGRGKWFLDETKKKLVPAEPGTFFHMPPDAWHGLENTGDEVMKILLATAPPNGPVPEWGAKS